ncbi:MAG: O-antigen ligase family protein [Acidovorax sp.]|jgi:O-antigen ligase|nr:O-antigen ligase family protein [Acidovorax sp.]
MKIYSGLQRVEEVVLNFSIFLFFSLFLVIPHAYSVAGILFLLTCFFSMPEWRNIYQDIRVRRFVWYFLCVAFFWSMSFDGWWAWNLDGDLPIKYFLAAVCIMGGCSIRIHPRMLIYSIALGCIFSAGLALIQFSDVEKASGYTNAIRFGDISLLMGMICWVFFAIRQFPIFERAFLAFAGCMGITASLLSLSRGGWFLLLVAPLVFCYGFYKEKLTKARLGIAVAAVVVVAVVGWMAAKDVPALNQRFAQATEQARGYFTDRGKYVNTSVGVRLEQWRMSWNLGLEKPITGWGDHGVWEGRKQFVLRGKADPSALHIAHTHNEFLEMWARRGLIGVISLALIYIVPFCIFIPLDKAVPEEKRTLYRSLHVAGMMVPVGYFIFGLSEVFFFLNIGNIFYIFSLILLFSAIKWIERDGGMQ